MRMPRLAPLKLFWIVAALLLGSLLASCNLVRDNPTTEPIITATLPIGSEPSIVINSPDEGDEFRVGDEVLVSASATDAVGVTRVQLFANNQIVRTVSSQELGGEEELNVVLNYTPIAEGDVTLRVVAYRSTVASDPAEVNIRVIGRQQATSTGQAPSTPAIDPNDPTCRALVQTGLNFRGGPGTVYNIIGVLSAGEVLPIVGRVGDNSWWQLRRGTTLGWVSSAFTDEFGNCFNVPIVAVPPTPTSSAATATPTPTVTVTPSASPTPTLSPTPGTPDLVITNFDGPQNVTIPSGETEVTETYNLVVSNIGSGRTGQFTAAVRILPSGDPFELNVGNLRPGESVVLNANITFDTAGLQIVQAEVDSDDTVDEISEFNNTATINVNVTGP